MLEKLKRMIPCLLLFLERFLQRCADYAFWCGISTTVLVVMEKNQAVDANLMWYFLGACLVLEVCVMILQSFRK